MGNLTMKCFLLLSLFLLQTLLISARVGRKCSEDKICKGPYEECSEEGKCACKNIATEVEHVCFLYASELNGYFCQYSEQCGLIKDDSAWVHKHAQCSEEKKLCRCEDDKWTITNNNCVKKEAECNDNKDCKDNEICFDNDCLPKASKSNGYACEHTEQCEHIEDQSGFVFNKHAKCDNNQCRCRGQGWMIEDDKCTKGQVECKQTEDCHDDAKVCVKNRCLAKSSEENQYACIHNLQCRHIKDTSGTVWAQYATCDPKSEKCTCHQKRWTISGNECIKSLECKNNTDCEDRSFCVKDSCKKRLGSKCEDAADCEASISHSSCVGGSCECEEGYKPNKSGDTCRTKKSSKNTKGFLLTISGKLQIKLVQV